jgi:hypothetical protein
MNYASTLLPRLAVPALVSLTLAASHPAALRSQSLAGSHDSMLRQNLVAQQHDYAYLRTPEDVALALQDGTLVPVTGNEDFELADGEVSFRCARPEVKAFLEQLSESYHAACGEPLVVTSLTRPITRQPWNASPISVHPTGMAIDIRRSDRRSCRNYIERTLLALKAEGMIEAIHEYYPPHYHVAVFPDLLLLPGPIGDPHGVARLAALHGVTGAGAFDVDDGSSHLRVARSRRNGRLQITQTAIAHRSGRHGARYAVNHGGRYRPVPAVLHHARRGHVAHATHSAHAAANHSTHSSSPRSARAR